MAQFETPVDFILGLNFSHLSEDVLDAARRGLTDTLGVSVAGSTTQLSGIIRDHASQHFGAGTAQASSLWNDGRTVSPAGAALANGMTIDSLDAHDGYKPAKGHVGCGLIPALIAMVEATGNTNNEDFLCALVMGYEVGSRAGAALHATAPDYHTSGAWISLASAAVAARYLGLDEKKTKEALGIAEYHGPRSQMMRVIDHPTMLKDGSGWGAMAGISAAYLARDGFTGAPAISVEREDAAPYWSDLGTRWLVKEQYIKLYPVCRWAQPPVEAALALKKEHRFSTEDIEQIEILTFHEAVCLATRHPASSSEAQYSLPFAVAAALVHDTIEAEHVDEAALDEPRTAALRDKIHMAESETFNSEFPARRIAQVGITLTSGEKHISQPTEAIGDPENPVSNDVIKEKFLGLTSCMIGVQQSKVLLECCQTLGMGSTVSNLLGLLTPAP